LEIEKRRKEEEAQAKRERDAEEKHRQEVAAQALEIAQNLMQQSRQLNQSTRASVDKLANGVAAINTDRVLRNLFAVLVVTTGPNGGIITYASELVFRVSGYRPEELVGHSIDMLIPPEVLAAHKYYRMGYEANPNSRSMGPDRDVLLVTKDGNRIRVWVGLEPDKVTNPEYVTAVILPKDIGYGDGEGKR